MLPGHPATGAGYGLTNTLVTVPVLPVVCGVTTIVDLPCTTRRS